MTELVYTEQALVDLERLSDFLLETDPKAAQDTAILIFETLEILVQHPEIGRKVHFGQLELVISRGRTDYLALYRFLPHLDRILVLALRHQRDSGHKATGKCSNKLCCPKTHCFTVTGALAPPMRVFTQHGCRATTEIRRDFKSFAMPLAIMLSAALDTRYWAITHAFQRCRLGGLRIVAKLTYTLCEYCAKSYNCYSVCNVLQDA